MKILIGGGTGFVGGALTRLLRSKGHVVEHISRRPGAGISWVSDGGGGEELGGWNRQFQEEVVSSRVHTTQTLATAITEAKKPPRIWVLLTGVGYYRPSLTTEYDENSAGGDFDFMSRLVRDWESAAQLAEDKAQVVRHVIVRSGVVLGKDGGAIKQMIWPFWLGVGGSIGSGRQYFPWIHVDDLGGILAHALENDSVSGILNGVAPAQNTNREFAVTLAASLGRPAVLPLPEFAVRAVLGAERGVMLLEGQRVMPVRTLQSGYKYRYPELRAALENIVT
ncbi:epimerase family protein SDR39U1 [Heterodontus francisci]|uniref:epimerase family protein SDR39U1 n=1 Tax=Heterodontus francisci TaxID=7792 RepID=UPI00355C6715